MVTLIFSCDQVKTRSEHPMQEIFSAKSWLQSAHHSFFNSIYQKSKSSALWIITKNWLIKQTRHFNIIKSLKCSYGQTFLCRKLQKGATFSTWFPVTLLEWTREHHCPAAGKEPSLVTPFPSLLISWCVFWQLTVDRSSSRCAGVHRGEERDRKL